MRWVWRIGGVVLALVLVVWLGGMLLPEEHVASRAALYRQPPEAVWKTIRDPEGYAAWRQGLRKAERLPDRGGHPVWREVDRHGQSITFETVEAQPPRRMVTRIAEQDLPFGGSWTFDLAPEGGGCRLRITENGRIYNPAFRFLARFVFGYASTIDEYLRGLGEKFGETVTPET